MLKFKTNQLHFKACKCKASKCMLMIYYFHFSLKSILSKAGNLTSVTTVLRFSLNAHPSLQEIRCVLLVVKTDRSMETLHVSALLFQSASNLTHLLNAPRDPVRGTVRSRTCCSEKAHFSWRPAVLHQCSGVYPKNTTPISTNASNKIGKDPKREILF